MLVLHLVDSRHGITSVDQQVFVMIMMMMRNLLIVACVLLAANRDCEEITSK